MVRNKILFHQATTSVTQWLRLVLLLLCFSISSILLADRWENTNYNTTEGSEFYITTMKNGGLTEKDSAQFKLYLYATSRTNTYIRVTNGAKYDKILPVSAGGQVGLNIPINYVYSDISGANVDEGYDHPEFMLSIPQNKSIYIHTCNSLGVLDTTAKVSVYITNYHPKEGFEATNVLPVRALEREYMVQTYHEDVNASEFAVVATENSQSFEVKLRLAKVTEEGDEVKCDESFMFTCNKGETRVFRSTSFDRSFSGSSICSNAKFLVVNGNQSAQITSGSNPISHIFEQTPSTDKWGKEYVATQTEGHKHDIVLLTAVQNNTKIYKDGNLLCTLNQAETYTDILDKEVAYYKSDNIFLCYLYEVSNDYYEEAGIEEVKHGSPSMSIITPLSMGVGSVVVAAFDANAKDLGLNEEEFHQMKEHYISIVTKTENVGHIYIGDVKITGFNVVPGNTAYSYATHLMTHKKSSNMLKCTNGGTFTARMYGDSYDSKNRISKRVSYSYSAGSRVNRAVDMLIDGEYINYKRVCIENSKINFEGIIDFEYDSLKWVIEDSTTHAYTPYPDPTTIDYEFLHAGLHDVQLVVYSHTPICDKPLVDTVLATIQVDSLNKIDELYDRKPYQEKCYGEEFVLYRNAKREKYTLKADTVTSQYNNKPFELNKYYSFYDTLPAQTDDECDTVLVQRVIIRPTYNHLIDTAACGEFVWTDTIFQKRVNSAIDTIIDTIHTFEILQGDILPITREFTHPFTSIYGCDSTVTMRVTLNKSYQKDTTLDVCQTLPGGTYNWEGHTGEEGRYLHKYDTAGIYKKVQEISLDTPGEFIYIDSLKTKDSPHCDSIHVLNLTIHPRYEDTISVTICQNDTFTWDVNKTRYVGSSFPSPQKTDTLLPKADSLYTFTEKFQTDYGCDSIFHLQLLVLPTYDTTVVANICDNEEYSFSDTILFRGEKLDAQNGLKAQSAPYEYTYHLLTSKGCDSIVTLQLYVHPTYLTEESVMICQGQSGVYEWNSKGVTPPFWCEELGAQVDEIKLDQLGTFTYIDSALTASGCYDIHILHLTVGGYAIEDAPQYLCDNDTLGWYDRLYVGYNFNQSYIAGNRTVIELEYNAEQYEFRDSIVETSSQGCDSTHYLTLYVSPAYITPVKIDTISLCDNESYTFCDSIYNQNSEWKSDEYRSQEYVLIDTVPSVFGCDSVVMHVVNVHPTYKFGTSESTCQYSEYVWKIIKRTATGGMIEVPVEGEVVDQDGNILDAQDISTNIVGNFTYMQSKTTKHGCDSTLILHLRIESITEIYDTLQLCDDDTISWYNHLYVGQKYTGNYDSEIYDIVVEGLMADVGTFSDTISTTNAYGCAQNYYLTLNIYPTYEKIDSITTCDSNNPYVWITSDKNGVYNDLIYFTPSSEYIDPNTNNHQKDIIHIDTIYRTLASVNDCDSVVQLCLTICPTYVLTTIDTICQSIGDNYDWDEHNKAVYSQEQGKKVSNISLDAVGNFTYVDSLQTTFCTECDSVHILQLTVLPSYIMRDTVMISEEETYYWSETNKTYGGEKTTLPHDITIYQDTVVQRGLLTDSVGSHACDSVLLLTIIVGEVYRDTTYATICGNETYTWVGKNHNGSDSVRMKIEVPQTKIYTDQYKTALGFDSIFYLNLTTYPAYVGIDSMTMYARVCQDTEYLWVRPNANGHPKRLYSMDENTWIDAANIPTDRQGVFTYKDSLYTVNGCDSVYTLVLQVDSAYAFTDVIDICNDSFAIWEDTIYVGTQFTGVLPNDFMPVVTLSPQTNYLADTLYKTITGCDSTRYLCLNVHPLYSVIDYQTTCDEINPYVWETIDKYGSYFDTIRYTSSEEYIDPITNKPTKDIIEIDTVFRSLTSVYGCDSIVQLHLTISPTYKFETPARICANDSIEWRGKVFHGAGGDTIHVDHDTTIHGCDSLYILDLKKIPVSQTDITLHICTNCMDTMYHDKDTTQIIWYPEMFPRPTSKTITYKAAGTACDSIFNYKFVYHPSYQIDSIYSICSTDSVRIHDGLLFWLDKYYDPVDGMSVPIIDTLICDTLCAAYTCINDSGLLSTECCDSIYTAHLTIFPVYKHVDSVAICSNEKYVWLDTVLYEPLGDSTITYFYQKSYTTEFGCDSVYEMYLTVHQAYDEEIYETICADEYYQFGDILLNQTGEYMDTLRTIHDCDSIVHLYLTVLDTTIVITYDTICVTEKYHFFDTIYTEPGLYDTITLNEWGCKQYNYLYLEVIDTTAYEIAIGDIICADDEEIIVYYERLSGKTLIEYSVLFDDLGHAQGFEDIYHATLDTTESYFSIPIPRGEVLPHPNPTYFDSQQGINEYVYEDKYAYPIPNLYSFKIIMHNGICGDSLQRKDTTVSFWYPSWIHEQHWNDGIVLYNEIYNGGYKFSKYQWFLNGDSILGATKEYLYVPNQLEMNQRGECDNYYQLAVTRLEDGYTTLTCPICPVLLYDTIVPQKDYFSVVPTIVSKINPTIHILSTRPGSYKITNLMGNQKQGDFAPDANNYAGSINLDEYLLYGITNQLILVTLTLDTGDKRTIKVIIRN